MRKHLDVNHSKSHLESCLQKRQHHYRTEKKSLAGQGFFYPWRVQRDRTPKCQLWNLIKAWTEWKGMQTTFGELLRKFVDCLSVHMGDHRGSRWISWDAGMTLCVWRRMSLFSRDTSWSIYEWSFVMFSTHFKPCREKMREGESECGTQAKSIRIWLTVLFFTLYIDLNIFKRKVRDKSRVGKTSLQKMWSPVSAHFLFPTLSVFSVFLCLIWYVPPNVKINADTDVSLVYDFRSI